MSLRVLLADESDTIKKVFQLALQDLNAEIKSVHSGLDVIDVAQSFKPNIIFADVLLQKKNGYETCREIKQNPNLAKTPVVLMWSSFMELDQEQFKKSKADDQLEKPFDADFLRELIKKYVPQTQENPLGQFLNFPKSISAGLKAEAKAAAPLAETPIKEDTSEFNIASFLDQELPVSSDDSKLNIPNMPASPPADTPAKEEAWLSADLSKFKIDLEAPSDNLEKFEALNLGERSVATESPAAGEKSLPSFSLKDMVAPPPMTATPSALAEDDERTEPSIVMPAGSDMDQILQFESSLSKSASLPTTPPKTSTETRTRTTMGPSSEGSASQKVATVGLNDDEIEALIRAHTEEVLKTQILDTLTEVIERIVRDELSKLLDEEVRLKQDIHSDNI